MKPTAQQQAAIETHDKNIIVVAGAGSGKTFVLVQRFLALLDANPDWPLNALVAITFTRKAAGEMRDRVRQGLQTRYQAATSDAERNRWSVHLSAMDSARINTIHGLCGDILRANAAEAQLDPKFEVLDETQSPAVLLNAIDDVLKEVGADADHPALPLFNVFSEFHIRSVLSALYDTDFPEQPENLMQGWQEQWDAFIVEAAQDILNDTIVQEWLTNAPHTVTPTEQDEDKFMPTWLEALYCAEKLQNTSPHICFEAIQNLSDKSKISFRGGSAKNWGGKEDFDRVKDWLKHVRALAETTLKIVGDPLNANDELAAQMIPMWLDLLGRVKNRYRQLKTQLAALDFDDLETRTLELLSTFDHVAERYRAREFKHLLVDEFQDTNNTQWQIVKALAGLDHAGSMFVVGDPKQSIYAFRGADVSVFEQVQGEITDHGGVVLHLSESRRTHKPLVDTFNALFQVLLVRNEASPVKAYEIQFGLPMDAARAEPPQMLTPHLHVWKFEGSGAEAYRREEARITAEKIHAWVSQGLMVHDKATDTTRPIRYGDFALLFQAMTNAGLYEEALRQAGVPFITIAGRGYYERQEVTDLLNLLRALYNRADNLSLAAALRSAIFGFSDDMLYALRLDDSSPLLWDSIQREVLQSEQPNPYLSQEDRVLVNFAFNTLTELQRIAGRVTISEVLREALTLTGFMATLSGLEDGAQRRSNVEKLLSKAQMLGKVTLSEFTQFLGDMSESEVREGDAALEVADVVQLMSVHKSKGLEFPVVILPDTSRAFKNSLNSPQVVYDSTSQPALVGCKVQDENGEWVRPFAYRRVEFLQGLRDEAERRRLLYVAATRARDMIIISGQMNKKDDGSKGWFDWILSSLNTLDGDAQQFQVDTFEIPEEDTESYRARETGPAVSLPWDDDRIKRGDALDGDILEPALLGIVEIQRPEQARHLAATSVADLGSVEETSGQERDFYRGRFRRKVLYDAPNVIKPVLDRRQSRLYVSKRQIGEIVHTALQYWRFPQGENDADYKRLLTGYAWNQGIASAEAADDAADKAIGLVEKFMQSELYFQIEKATEVYRELPFIYERERFIVHGIIDVLFRKPNGTWVVADYKTASVANFGYPYDMDKLRDHARRYHLQVGMYADAVQQQLGSDVLPETKIHYIRYGRTVEIDAVNWQQALNQRIGDRIRVLIEDEEDEARSLQFN